MVSNVIIRTDFQQSPPGYVTLRLPALDQHAANPMTYVPIPVIAWGIRAGGIEEDAQSLTSRNQQHAPRGVSIVSRPESVRAHEANT